MIVRRMESPSGSVAFLFTDIEGSTVRWDRDPKAMQQAVRQHDALLRALIEQHHGHIFKALGDAFCVSFHDVAEAAIAALAAQRMLAQQDFSAVDGLRVRIAIHVGESDEREGDYFGPTLNRVSRLLAIGHGGQVLLSGSAAALADGALPADATLLDLGEHRLKDLVAFEHVFQLLAPDIPSEFPKLRSLTILNNNLPLQLTSLVGREQDVADITALLDASRLVTLCGAGGLGKTRCALQVGADVLDAFDDGVWFADLAPLSDPLLVGSEIASIFDLVESPSRPILDTVVEHLKHKRLLLILDNCEHLINAASQTAAAILRSCPNVKIVATSREILNLPGESVYRMPTLGVPRKTKSLTAESALAYGAIALFATRAHSANARFTLTDDNAPTVAEVCLQLDGIPLAIELAAARMKMLTPTQLAQRLHERFRILTGGDRAALPRQQTLRALIDWSYDLLSEDEQQLFRYLAIFSNGFTLETAMEVDSAASTSFDVLDLLSSLVDKSLVLAEPAGDDIRYRLLESMREYGREKLIERDELTRAASLHAGTYTELAEKLTLNYETTPYRDWLSRAEPELDNFRTALAWSFGPSGDPLTGERLAATLHRVFGVFAAAEARRWVDVARQRVDATTPPLIVAQLYLVEAFLASAFNLFRWSLEAAEHALTIFAHLQDDRGMAESQRLAGRSMVYLGRVDEGEKLLNESLATRRKIGSTHVGGTLRDLAAARGLQGDVAAARTLFAQAAAAYETGTDEGNVAITAVALAEAEFRTGDALNAIRYSEEALEAVRALNRQRETAAILGNIAAYFVALDRFEPARLHAREALEVAREVQDSVSVAFALQHLAATAALRTYADDESAARDRARAANLLGHVDTRLTALETVREYTEQQEHDRTLAALRDALGADDLAKLMNEGRTWSEEKAIAEALLV
jgi:predicted ATPase/class 3 adenylate cyclase/tetratricopeptide (TPR) repeat protein